jgi:hypothetical protein
VGEAQPAGAGADNNDFEVTFGDCVGHDFSFPAPAEPGRVLSEKTKGWRQPVNDRSGNSDLSLR